MSKEAMKLALKRAFQLGQDYWYQADHESYKQNKKSDETLAKFRQLVDETCEALAEQPAQQKPEPPSNENITDAWVSASDSDGVAYDGPSFERGYRLGRGEYDEYTGALVAAALAEQPAQRTWVEVEQVKWEGERLIAKLKEKNT